MHPFPIGKGCIQTQQQRRLNKMITETKNTSTHNREEYTLFVNDGVYLKQLGRVTKESIQN